MADLKETDVEKAGVKYGPGRTKFGQKNLNPSKLMRRHGFRMSDSQHAQAQSMFDEFGEKGVRQYLRNRRELRGKVRKSAAPIDSLYAEIEKARPLLARGKDGTRRGTVGGVKVSLGRSGKSNGGARLFRAGSKLAYLDKPSGGGNSGRNQTRAAIKRYLASLKAGR